MAQVYLNYFCILDYSTTGSYLLWVDSSGNIKSYNTKADALNDAKVAFGNGKFKIMGELKVDATDSFDESG